MRIRFCGWCVTNHGNRHKTNNDESVVPETVLGKDTNGREPIAKPPTYNGKS